MSYDSDVLSFADNYGPDCVVISDEMYMTGHRYTMVKKLKYERPLMRDGTHRYMGPSIYKGTVTDETFNTIVKMVADSQESVKDKLCHTTTMNNRLEFQEVPEHFDALGEIFQHVSRYTRSLNTCDWREVEDLNLDNVWMNVQHANQSIGHHTHEEADYAFVIYVRNTLTDPTIELYIRR